jgi:nucleoside-diphosphate-sugar epimerase
VATKVFVAGATGLVGKRLVPLLIEAGYDVVGMTRSPDRTASLKIAGATPVVVDVFDAPRLMATLADVRPAIVVHQLTDLPDRLDPAEMPAALVRNARIRREGTRNLAAAAAAAGIRRFIAQSIAWVYAPGPEPHGEDDPLDPKAESVAALESETLGSPSFAGVVLRYGRFYGPETGTDTPPADGPLHVDAAAHAAFLAVEKEASGIFNIAEPNPHITTDRAIRELGFNPGFRLRQR